MQDRFKFNAIVSSYYDIDTPENYEEFEPKFYLKKVDVFCTGEIGVDYDELYDTVREQSKDLSEKEIGQIMQHFEDNSNSPECDYVTIRPDKIIQSTGLKDKNGKLIYEGDIIQFYIDDDDPYARSFVTMKIVWEDYELDFKAIGLNKNVECYKDDFQYLSCINIQQDELEVIGNIYENSELLGDKR